MLLKIYFHRFYRLVPFLSIIMILGIGFYSKIGDGPLWVENGVVNSIKVNCEKSWWTNILFVTNFANIDSGCINWTWYLANDMQFFLTLPILVFIFTRSKPLGYMVNLGLITANLICSLIIAIAYKGDPNPFADGGESNQKMYYKPWTRCGAYFVGSFFGFMYWDYKN